MKRKEWIHCTPWIYDGSVRKTRQVLLLHTCNETSSTCKNNLKPQNLGLRRHGRLSPPPTFAREKYLNVSVMYVRSTNAPSALSYSSKARYKIRMARTNRLFFPARAQGRRGRGSRGRESTHAGSSRGCAARGACRPWDSTLRLQRCALCLYIGVYVCLLQGKD